MHVFGKECGRGVDNHCVKTARGALDASRAPTGQIGDGLFEG